MLLIIFTKSNIVFRNCIWRVATRIIMHFKGTKKPTGIPAGSKSCLCSAIAQLYTIFRLAEN